MNRGLKELPKTSGSRRLKPPNELAARSPEYPRRSPLEAWNAQAVRRAQSSWPRWREISLSPIHRPAPHPSYGGLPIGNARHSPRWVGGR
jgi:hypothetical protein